MLSQEEQDNATSKATFHKEAFARTSQKRQDKVLEEAINEFANKGYAGTNINIIAANAGISIGAMYSYFSSKEDLFLTSVSRQFEVLNTILTGIDTSQNFFNVLTQLFTLTRDNARRFPRMSQIYLDVTSQSMAPMAEKLSDTFEHSMADFLLDIIEKAKKDDVIRADTDSRALAFSIDNLLVMFQFSFSSTYYQERMKLFLGEQPADDDSLIKAMVGIIKNQL